MPLPYPRAQLLRDRNELHDWMRQHPYSSVKDWPGWRLLDKVDWSQYGWCISVYLRVHAEELSSGSVH